MTNIPTRATDVDKMVSGLSNKLGKMKNMCTNSKASMYTYIYLYITIGRGEDWQNGKGGKIDITVLERRGKLILWERRGKQH